MHQFTDRHIGPRASEIQEMLRVLDIKNLEELLKQAAPKEIQLKKELNLKPSISESKCLEELKKIANKNQIFQSYIGQGYYETNMPTVIQRNILENPIWLTSYTPYQPEIAQGRLQALLNFQTMITELSDMDIANASLLDAGTAAAEAIYMAYNHRKRDGSKHVFMDQHIFLQTKKIIESRAKAIGLLVDIGDAEKFNYDEKYFCVLLQTPAANGRIIDWENLCQQARNKGIASIFSTDLMSLCLFKTPGKMGADIVTGSCQRFGLGMMGGGPHAAYLAAKKEYTRLLPGRVVGVSKDRHGKPALRLAIQTREQHIRRERATSNICTAQALLAVLASMFAMYHGVQGLYNIAKHIHHMALYLIAALKKIGFVVSHTDIFDTVQVKIPNPALQKLNKAFIKNKINVATWDKGVSLSMNETTTEKDIKDLIRIFLQISHSRYTIDEVLNLAGQDLKKANPFNNKSLKTLSRQNPILKHKNFSSYHSETRLLRYIHSLQSMDLSLTHSMIPLGSCTMKLNATTELLPVTWPAFAKIHPFAPLDQLEGYRLMIQELGKYLCEITGFEDISFQPNAGSQGEYAGLLAIRHYHENIGAKKKDVCLIPVSAHGTNPASARMAGLKVVELLCDSEGNISHDDLEKKLKMHGDSLAALMITYPSTFGIFEKGLPEICNKVHTAGGLVYLDGANMNALVGISRPADWGVDICHLNLHKTFCIPHGGGGPGVGPILTTRLKKYLPGHWYLDKHAIHGFASTSKNSWDKMKTNISSAPWGSAGILMISWAYIRLMGASGLKQATSVAILNANYLAKRLSKHFKILYRKNALVAHECIIDLRKFYHTAGVSIEDIAKRLMDYGFHAPTMSWPVPGTLMVEPTESEDKIELDRFSEALILIRQEIQEIMDKKYSKTNNVFKNAPHVLEDATKEKWPFPYSQQKAFYPLSWVKEHKFWPAVSRVEQAYGDIHLFCTCPPMNSLSSER